LLFVANYILLSLLRLVFLKLWAAVWVGALFSVLAGLAANSVTWMVLDLFAVPLQATPMQAGFLYVVIMLLTSAQQLARTRRYDSEAKIRSVIADLEIINSHLRQEAWLNRKRLASVLHGHATSAVKTNFTRPNFGH
jgi:hypothetical protein